MKIKFMQTDILYEQISLLFSAGAPSQWTENTAQSIQKSSEFSKNFILQRNLLGKFNCSIC
jgi:hypothetical protein